MRARIGLVAGLLAGLDGSIARADWTAFLPTPAENHMTVETFSSFERDATRGTAATVSWTDVFVRERLGIESNGYSYDPRFAQYQFSLGVAFKQEDYENTGFDHLGWTNGNGIDYDLHLEFLPEHPYNLTLFANRYESTFKEQSATQHSSVGSSLGAAIQYREKPYLLHSSFVDDTVESGESSSDVRRANFDGQYFKRFAEGNEFSLSASAAPSWFSTDGGLDGTGSDYLVSNFVNLQRFRLTSDVTRSGTDQTSDSTGKLSSDAFGWNERGTAYLPWGFRTDLTYRYIEDRSVIHDSGAGGASTGSGETGGDGVSETLASHGNEARVDIVHRLYESLDTTYTFLRDARTSTGGSTVSTSNGLAMNYTKSIPYGTLLAGADVSRDRIDSEGTGTDVVNEPHSGISVPTQPFTLNQPNVDEQSIVVLLHSPLPPFESILLTRDQNYTVTAVPNLNTFEILVFALPPQFLVPGSYDFVVSYALLGGNFALRADTLGADLSVQLFDDLLTPYARYLVTRSDVLAGSFSGFAVDSTTYTAGLRLYRGPFRLRGEFEDLEWEVAPYDAWRADGQYVDTFYPGLSVYLSAGYEDKRYRSGNEEFSIAPYTERTVNTSVSVQKRFLVPEMTFGLGGAYAHFLGQVDSDAFSVDGNWTLTVGKLDCSLGASGYFTQTDARREPQDVHLERDHELVYVKLSRRIF